MRRELVSVKTGIVYGAVDDRADPPFQGDAGVVLRALRQTRGDAAVVRDVLAGGWSNGYLYFAEPTR